MKTNIAVELLFSLFHPKSSNLGEKVVKIRNFPGIPQKVDCNTILEIQESYKQDKTPSIST